MNLRCHRAGRRSSLNLASCGNSDAGLTLSKLVCLQLCSDSLLELLLLLLRLRLHRVRTSLFMRTLPRRLTLSLRRNAL